MKKLLILLPIFLSFSALASSEYNTYRIKYAPENVVIKLEGFEARVLYKQLVGPDVREFNFSNLTERLGTDMKCMKINNKYTCEIEIDSNGKTQTPGNG
jgi:hypothetical protein